VTIPRPTLPFRRLHGLQIRRRLGIRVWQCSWLNDVSDPLLTEPYYGDPCARVCLDSHKGPGGGGVELWAAGGENEVWCAKRRKAVSNCEIILGEMGEIIQCHVGGCGIKIGAEVKMS
jgi:hypothetical protein